jgi:uncharacterized protein (DUF302 family)
MTYYLGKMLAVSFYLGKMLAVSFDEAVTRTKDALKSEGFGVLTEIDVKETLKKKIGADFPSYRILGACNPELAMKLSSLRPRSARCCPAMSWFAMPARVARKSPLLIRSPPCRR